MGVANHEENEGGGTVCGSRFVNPIFYSLANEVLSVCISVARMYRKVVAIVSFQKNGPHTLRFFLHQYRGRTRIEFIHFHVLVMQSFQNLQVVTRQQVEEFARRLIFPFSQAVVAVSEKSSLLSINRWLT